MNPPLRLLTTMHETFGTTPTHLLRVPKREMWVAAEPTDGHAYTLIAPDANGRTTFDRRAAKQKRTHHSRPLPHWARHMAGVIVVLGDDAIDVPAFTAVVVGDEPSGPRYQHACGMAIAALSLELVGDEYDLARLLDIMERVQSHYLT